MSKTNFFVKYLKNISYFINNLLEKNLNKLNFKNLSYLLKNNKIIFTFVALFVVFISYLLLPTFFNHSDFSNKLKTDLQNKLDINFEFSQNINYNIFPKPHFIINETTISENQKEISKINKLKIFVSFSNLFSPKSIEIKNLILEDANFNLNKLNFNFFIKLLDKNFKDGSLTIKNSNIFYRNQNEEVLFINKILKMNYYYDIKEEKNIIHSENELFNIPFSIKSYFNKNKSKIFSLLSSKQMKLKIENELNYNNEKIIGKSQFIINKQKRYAQYQIEEKNFQFKIFDKEDKPSLVYNGKFNLKPFYANLDANLDKINLEYIIGSNSIIVQLLKTEIFNHKNIDFHLNINADNILNHVNFNNINLKSKIKEGLIDTDKTKFQWRSFANFELSESLIFVREGELVLDGKLSITVNDYSEIYKFLLTPKNYRHKISKIDFNFTYNFDQKIAQLKDISIDNQINLNVNKILNNIVLKKTDLQNKIYFKNLLNQAIKSYAG